MRHPFDGIIVPAVLDEQHGSSRREALALLAGAGVASLAVAVANADDAVDGAAPAAEAKYRLYYVVPKEVRLFDARRRMDLNVRGEMLPGLPLHKELGDKSGFLAWLNADEAAKVQAADDVALAHEMTPADVMVQGAPPTKGVATLRVFAAPLGWRTPPAADTYLNLTQLGTLWTSQLAMKDGVTVIANETVRQPFIQFAEGKVAADVLDTIKSQPQVYALQWLTPVADTTRAVGEEGGIVTTEALREEAATTLALGEEGASTEAVGEEGVVTTFAVGEEGAAPSTRALGEEGGRPTTDARGEEGGVTTKAVGEEGGGISTRALGEEGGRPDVPASDARLEEGRATTQAIGEEGGEIRRPRPAPRTLTRPRNE